MDKLVKIAVHNDDIDGIACAALFLRKFPNAEIKFLSVDEAKRTSEIFDYIADLPKSPNAKINIDHHESNLERLRKEKKLSPNDYIDPSSPSAAHLVAEYLGLRDDISKQIVEMADRADRGKLNGELYKLDKLIKLYVRDQKMLRKLAEILASKGANFSSDPVFQALWSKLERELVESEKRINKVLERLKKSGAKYALVLQNDSIPYFMAKDIAYKFLELGGHAIAVFYRDPNTGLHRVSIRIGEKCEIVANKITEKLGGGGHRKAAGATFHDLNYAVGVIASEFGSKGFVVIVNMGELDD